MANIDHKPSTYMLNLLHVLTPYADEEKGIAHGLVEINTNSINKYEFITESGQLKLDRVGYSSLTYPVAYGLIPQTWDQDNDMLDFVIANVTEPLVPGSLAEVRVIGVMKFEDGGERDDKVITVLSDDKRMDHIKTYEDLGPHWEKETAHYFEHYKDLEPGKWVKVLGWDGIDAAHKEIVDGVASYKKSLG